ncbi:MAG: cell wall-associated protein wapA [Bdellovibrionales bacterium]|nr:cell wall-associated protein wapA [Bdellovibrionales bacterium]
MKWILILAALFFSQNSLAIVDMRLANYSDTWTDLELPGTGYDLKVTRTYNSRSLYNGMFGFGWCSDFETSFAVQADGSIHLKECGDGRLTIYTNAAFSTSNVKRVVDEIVKKEASVTKGVTKTYIDTLRANLMLDHRQRQVYADKYKISSGAKKGTVYKAGGESTETLVLMNDYYERTFSDGTKQRFDLNGNLTHLYDKNGNFLRIKYSQGRIQIVGDNNGRQLSFSYYENGKVKAINGPGGISASYKYERLNDLSWVKSAWNNEYTFKYDELHNLVRISFPDKTFKEIQYNTNKDWVTAFKDRNGCAETYKYEFDKKDPKDHYWADVLKKCDGKVDTQARFEFWFKPKRDGTGKFLARSYSKINNDVNDVFYSDINGKPLRTVSNGKTSTFTYYPNGFLKERRSGNELAIFKYNTRNNKVSEVQIGKRKTVFRYDEKGNLTFAKSTEGQAVKIDYDAKGRIVALADQAKRVVKITYDSQFGKPAVVERPGVGRISVAYKPNGEIKKIDSDAGPTVAGQIASTFRSLLDVVSPAGIDLGL